jgi:hypothetical protein
VDTFIYAVKLGLASHRFTELDSKRLSGDGSLGWLQAFGLCFVGIDLKAGPTSNRKIRTEEDIPLKVEEVEWFFPNLTAIRN